MEPNSSPSNVDVGTTTISNRGKVRLTVRYATAEDCNALAPKLRKADLDEIKATSGQTSLDVLTFGINHSDPCLSLCNDGGEVMALCGTIRFQEGSALVWLLASDELTASKYKRAFLAESVRWINALNTIYPTLIAITDVRNTVHANWLKWCGFSPTHVIPEYGVEKRPFQTFGRSRHV